MSKLQLILLLIQTTLTALSKVPVVGPDAVLASSLLTILQNALALYQAETGKPFDATLIPQETPVP